MSGPGKPGPAAGRSIEIIDEVLWEANVLRLRASGMTHQQVADELSVDRSTISKAIPRILRKVLNENDAAEVRAMELLRCEQLIVRMLKIIDAEINPPAGGVPMVDDDHINTYIKLSRQKSLLSGAYAPKRVEILPLEDEDQKTERADEKADNVERAMTLLDRLMASGIGSGTIVDAELAEEDEAQYEFQPTAAPVTVEETLQPRRPSLTALLQGTPDEDPTPDGHWVDGKFIPDED